MSPSQVKIGEKGEGGSEQGIRPSTTSAWPGWKQPDIAVKAETSRLNTGWYKKCSEKCVLLYYPSTDFKTAFNVY
jgi:hypothetical protein